MKRRVKAIEKAKCDRQTNKNGDRLRNSSSNFCTDCKTVGRDEKVEELCSSLQTRVMKEVSSSVGGVLCVNCVSDFTQSIKAQQRTVQYNQIINTMTTLKQPKFSTMHINVSHQATGSLHGCYAEMIPKTIKIRMVEVPADIIQNVNVDGAYLFTPFKNFLDRLTARVIANPEDFDATLVVFSYGTTKRFVFLANIDMSSQSLLEHYIQQVPNLNKISPRSGSSGSFTFSDSKCASRSQVTLQEGTRVLAPPKGVGMNVV